MEAMLLSALPFVSRMPGYACGVEEHHSSTAALHSWDKCILGQIERYARQHYSGA
jgi:hypothetical protein